MLTKYELKMPHAVYSGEDALGRIPEIFAANGVKRLVVFTDRGAPFAAVDGFSLQMDRGEVVGIVGESGSGKSMTAHALMGLIRRSQVSVAGRALFEGIDLLSLSREELRYYQGRELSIIFQEPMTSLNPTMRIGRQVEESLRIHEKGLSPAQRRARALDAMALAGLSDPEGLYRQYPHQLSGGQRQRVAFARALAPNPQLLLLDEPFAAIDAKVRRELRSWLRKMIRQVGITSIFVTHDQEEAMEVADTIIITNDGSIEQIGIPEDICRNPKTVFVKDFVDTKRYEAWKRIRESEV